MGPDKSYHLTLVVEISGLENNVQKLAIPGQFELGGAKNLKNNRTHR